jgi:hypothetical protein
MANNSSWKSIKGRCSEKIESDIPAMKGVLVPRPFAVSGVARFVGSISSAGTIDRSRKHSIKSILKQVDGYDDETKLSMKLYHFQELSRLCVGDDDSLRVDRLKSLQEDLLRRDTIRALSPTQVAALFLSLRACSMQENTEWSLICDALKGTSPRMSCGEVSSCLHALGKAGRTFVVRDRVLESVLGDLLRRSNEWSMSDIGKILYFMRKCKARDGLPVWDKTLYQLAYRFNERLSDTSTPSQIACILSEFSHMGLLPAKSIHRACTKLLEHGFDRMDGKTITLLVMALTKLGVRKQDFVFPLTEFLAHGGLKRIRDPSSACKLLWGFGKLELVHPKLYSALLDHVGLSNDKLTLIDCRMVNWAISRESVMRGVRVSEELRSFIRSEGSRE